MRDYKTTRYTKRIAITEDDYEWILANKGKKSAAGFLEAVVDEFKKPTLFKKKK